MTKLIDLVCIKPFAGEGITFRRMDKNESVKPWNIYVIDESPVTFLYNPEKPKITMKIENPKGVSKKNIPNALLITEMAYSQYHPVYNALYCRVKHLKESRESRIVNRVREIFHYYTDKVQTQKLRAAQ